MNRCFSLYILLLLTAIVKAQTATVDELTISADCRSPQQAEVTYRKVVTIHNEQGAGHAVFVTSLGKSDRLTSFSGQAVSATGQVVRKFKKSYLARTEYSTMMAVDDYMLVLNFVPPTYPVTVTYEWTEQLNDDLIELPRFIPLTDYDVSLKQASYTVSTPESFPIRCHTQNISQQPQQHTENGRQLTTVSVSDLAPLEQEHRSRPLLERIPMAYFAPVGFNFYGHRGSLDSWQSYGNWAQELLKDRQALPPTVSQAVHQMTDSCTTARRKVKLLYDYLRKTTRYVSIQLGIGGHQPMAAADVARTGYGDCKALSNYMRALLAEAGIAATYTEISTRNRRLLPDFASVGQLNHVILQVPLPGDTLWLECTNPALPLGYVHEDIAGHDAVLITPEGGKLCRLPSYTDSLHALHSNVSISLANDGAAAITLTQQARHWQYESMAALAKAKATERNKTVLNEMNFPQPVMEQIDISVEEDQPLATLSARLRSAHYASLSGQRLFVPLCPLHNGYKAPAIKSVRQDDICILAGYEDADTIMIDMPEGYDVEAIPTDVVIEQPFGSFSFSLRRHDRQLQVTQRLLMRAGTYDKGLYPDYVAFIKQMAQTYGQRIVLVRSKDI